MLVLLQFLINIDPKLSSSCLDFLPGCGVLEASRCYVLPAPLQVTTKTQVLFGSVRIFQVSVRLFVTHALVHVLPPQHIPILMDHFTTRTIMLNCLFVHLWEVSLPRHFVTKPGFFPAPIDESVCSLIGLVSRALSMPESIVGRFALPKIRLLLELALLGGNCLVYTKSAKLWICVISSPVRSLPLLRCTTCREQTIVGRWTSHQPHNSSQCLRSQPHCCRRGTQKLC